MTQITPNYPQDIKHYFYPYRANWALKEAYVFDFEALGLTMWGIIAAEWTVVDILTARLVCVQWAKILTHDYIWEPRWLEMHTSMLTKYVHHTPPNFVYKEGCTACLLHTEYPGASIRAKDGEAFSTIGRRTFRRRAKDHFTTEIVKHIKIDYLNVTSDYFYAVLLRNLTRRSSRDLYMEIPDLIPIFKRARK